jgi:hypothetical protein
MEPRAEQSSRSIQALAAVRSAFLNQSVQVPKMTTVRQNTRDGLDQEKFRVQQKEDRTTRDVEVITANFFA